VQGEHAPALAGPGLGDAHPAGVAAVALAVAVPVEVDFDPAMMIAQISSAAGHHGGCLRAAIRGRGVQAPPDETSRAPGMHSNWLRTPP